MNLTWTIPGDNESKSRLTASSNSYHFAIRGPSTHKDSPGTEEEYPFTGKVYLFAYGPGIVWYGNMHCTTDIGSAKDLVNELYLGE